MNRYTGKLQTHTALALLIAVSIAYAAGKPASANADGNGYGNHRHAVSGDSVFSDCGDFAIELSGDLNGCLHIVPGSYTCSELNGFDQYNERGTELFEDEDGSSGFRTRYTLEARFSPGFCNSFNFALQITGGCLHTIVNASGRGKYRGAKGTITFSDVIPDPGESGATNFLYHGDLKLKH